MKNQLINEGRDPNSLGYKIYQLRTNSQINQEDLAAYLHVSNSTISNYENNKHSPDLSCLIKIADYFNVSIDFLLNRTEYVYPISLLEKKLVQDYTYSSMINTVIQLSASSQADLINYLDMLNLRDHTQRNNPPVNVKPKRKESQNY